MSTLPHTLERAKKTLLSAYEANTSRGKVNFYNSWAETYEEDVAALEFRAPYVAADTISTHFTGDREAALVLDVACGTGLVTKQMKKDGFCKFVGVDGSKSMLELARKSGLYQDLRQSVLGEDPLPFQNGGYVCMTSTISQHNQEYKNALENELKKMEEERLWSCVLATDMEAFIMMVSKPDGGYDSGTVYLYKKL